jgi:peptidyl-prolyl cis-trans isomerase B (cyclophilin B)
MPTNNRNLVIIALIIILLGIWGLSRRTNLNPTGKLEESSPVDITNLNASPAPITGRPQVEVSTTKGKFVIEMRPDIAQKTVVNFLSKFSSGFCENKTFHRVEDWVVQGCDPKGDGTGGEDSLPTETSSENFAIGSIGVARKAFPKEISNDSQFFIVKKDSSFLNGEYTNFGKVISGMDVINSLSVGDKILSTTILSK